MQLDKTHIAIRERGWLEICDLSLHVVREHAWPLFWAMLLGASHVFFMGYEGWLNPAGWHGSIPPVSLVAFTIFAVGYIVNLIGRK